MNLMRVLTVLLALISHQAFADWNYQTVEGAGGVPLNVVSSGDQSSPGILFIHGIGQSHYSFVRQLDSDLANDFYLVSFDLRGHGASGKPWTNDAYDDSRPWADDVAAVIEATGLDRPVIVAWSFGTLVAMDYVREFGLDGLSGINLTGALGALRPFRMTATDDLNAEAFAQLRELQSSPDLSDNIQASAEFTKWLTKKPLPQREHDLFFAASVMFPAYSRRAIMTRKFNNQDLEEKLTLPLLLSLGEHDNPGQLIDGAELASSYDNVQLSEYKGSGHSVFIEDEQRFNDELREFVQRAHSAAE